jgi:hypothetical protein
VIDLKRRYILFTATLLIAVSICLFAMLNSQTTHVDGTSTEPPQVLTSDIVVPITATIVFNQQPSNNLLSRLSSWVITEGYGEIKVYNVPGFICWDRIQQWLSLGTHNWTLVQDTNFIVLYIYD